MNKISPLEPTSGDGFESQRLKRTAKQLIVVNTGKLLIAKVATGVLGVIFILFGCFAFISGEGVASLGIVAIGGVALFAAKYVKEQKRIRLSLQESDAEIDGEVKVTDVVSIELIKKYVALPDISDTSVDGFDCFEVNVRLSNGQRYMLLNHGHWQSIQRDTLLLQACIKRNVDTSGVCNWNNNI